MYIHKSLLISTGGTIAGEVAGDRKATDYKIKSSDAFAELVQPISKRIWEEMGVKVEIDTIDYINEDSSNITPVNWRDLVDTIADKYDDYHSFVITHGTNTLGYTCAALSFAFANIGKPVVLTGSQVPMEMLGSDGLSNLENAFRVVCSTRHELKGVMAVFGSYVITGTRVQKETEFDFDTFRSFSSIPLARIGRTLDFDIPYLNMHKSYMERHVEGIAMTADALDVYNKFQTRILCFSEFPGLDPELLRKIVIENEIKGLVVRAFGAGDMSSHHIETLKQFKSAGIPVVIGTQAPQGNANLQVNNPGMTIRQAKLAIPAYDMSIEAQTAKLMWLLAQKDAGLINFKQLCRQMISDMRGEIRVVHEPKYRR